MITLAETASYLYFGLIPKNRSPEEEGPCQRDQGNNNEDEDDVEMVVLVEGNVLSDRLQPIGASVSAHVLYPPGSLDIVHTVQTKFVFFPPSPQASLPCPSTGCGSSPSWPPSPCRPSPF